MIDAAAIWLPDCAIAHRSLTTATERCLDDWSGHWFVKARAMAKTGWRTASGEPLPDKPPEPWRKADPRIGLSIIGDGRPALGAAMLARRYPDPAMRPADVRLLEELADQCLSDLSDRLVELLALPTTNHGYSVRPSQPATQSCELYISLDDHPPFACVRVAIQHLFSVLRALLPSPRRHPPPDPIIDAVADRPLELAALIGCTRIALPELERLEIGDVIIVDRPIEDRLDLYIENRRRANSAISVDLNDTSLQLRITEAPTQWQD